ncbi:hypothetical protein [Bartonella koehlerae]|uniref:hypothetical protein n=1 Tax=Bartonella koehlerae TaxID=92181 RepID=UPI000B225382|nr:hypothetical protein [Bartonella koehlerae]
MLSLSAVVGDDQQSSYSCFRLPMPDCVLNQPFLSDYLAAAACKIKGEISFLIQ